MDANLKEQVMINQFIQITGCHHEQAWQFLNSANWHFEGGLSAFFQETPLPACRNCNGNHPGNGYYQMCAPTNTPVTPPNFPDALSMLANMSTKDKISSPSTIYVSTSTHQTNTAQSYINQQSQMEVIPH